MPEIGLFPLGTVLLPTEQVPLHIFEPRYRELIEECLGDSSEFGLLYVDEDGMRAIGTRAAVVEVTERLEDGRLNIVVQGGARFRLVRLTEGRSFHTGVVEDVSDQDDPAPEGDRERARKLFWRLVELTGVEVDVPEGADDELSYALAGRFDFSPDIKQALLQQTSERERLQRLCALLEAAAEAVERQREISRLAQANGHVQPSPSES